VVGVVLLVLVGIASFAAKHGGWKTSIESDSHDQRPLAPAAMGAAVSVGRIAGRLDLEFSEKYGVAYCDIPKAASSTLTSFMVGLERNMRDIGAVQAARTAEGTASVFQMMPRRRYYDLQQEGGRYKTFTVVRHPGTRLYSAWFDKMHTQKGGHLHDLYAKACGGDPGCTFETFVNRVARLLEKPAALVNTHVARQVTMCDPSSFSFDMVYQLEDGFGVLAKRLEKWTGVRFDFMTDAVTHHSTGTITRVYDSFPVHDVASYESLMPYHLQMQIYNAYKADFLAFGYAAPVARHTQLTTCPHLRPVDGDARRRARR